jgi:hypothetical protein
MLELRERQRAVLIDKVPDLANVAAGALIFGQLLNERPISPVIAVTGLGVWVVLAGFALALARKEKQ